MRAFGCQTCGSVVSFTDRLCAHCGAGLAFFREQHTMVCPDPTPAGARHFGPDGTEMGACLNEELADCNWLAPSAGGEQLCDCCLLTRTRPPDNDPAALGSFAGAEAAKRRLLYQLDVLRLPTTSRATDPKLGLAFDLVSGMHASIATGHDNGVITIDVSEAGTDHQYAMRESLDGPFRTMLGHMRHEIAHWYWALLVDGTENLPRFREIFGDERSDYQGALASFDERRARGKLAFGSAWRAEFVSRYASAHPWEDWAETFALYLHLRDTIETTVAFRLRVTGPPLQREEHYPDLSDEVLQPPVGAPQFDTLLQAWTPLTLAFNAVSLSTGQPASYTWSPTAQVRAKLRFVHDLVAIL